MRYVIEDELAKATLAEFPEAAQILDQAKGYSRSFYNAELQMRDIMKADFDESQCHKWGAKESQNPQHHRVDNCYTLPETNIAPENRLS